MDAMLMMNAIVLNPLGGWSREIAEWYWAKYQLQNTRRDLLNLATFT
jgi:hypothetical protein